MIDLAWRGIGNLGSHGAFARMPYWLSLFADVSARSYRPGAARAILDTALADGHAHDDMWWLREGWGCAPPATTRRPPSRGRARQLRSAAAHGGIRLLRRCRRDRERQGIPRSAPGVRLVAWRERMGPERCANAAVHTFGPYTGFRTTYLKETT